MRIKPEPHYFKNKYKRWMSIVFFLTAISFIFDVWGTPREVIQHRLVDPVHFSKEPVRKTSLEPLLTKEDITYRCNDCHQHLIPSTVQKSYFSAHPDIELQHGRNNHCLTCHSQTNREMFRDIQGKDIPYQKSELACLSCHGTKYNDMQNGVHGRINGYWDESRGEKKKLTCVQCHDPHQPKFKSMQPAPAPHNINYLDFSKEQDTHHGAK